MPQTCKCPTCGRDDFASEQGMKTHHKRSHGESIKGKLFECHICGDEFRRLESNIVNNSPTCSTECMATAAESSIEFTCSQCELTFERWPSNVRQSDKQFCSKECFGEYYSGENNPHWKGGVRDFYNRTGCKWRDTIFERDDYTCQDCDQRGGYLNAHHIKPRSECEIIDGIDERYAIWNGVTLCTECHANRHEGDTSYEMLKWIADKH